MSLTYQVSHDQAELQSYYQQEQGSPQNQQQKPFGSSYNQDNFIFLPEDSLLQYQPMNYKQFLNKMEKIFKYFNYKSNQTCENINYEDSYILNSSLPKDTSYNTLQQNFIFNENNCANNELNACLGTGFEPNNYCNNNYSTRNQYNLENFISLQPNNAYDYQESENIYNNQQNQLIQGDQIFCDAEQAKITPQTTFIQMDQQNLNMQIYYPQHNSQEKQLENLSKSAIAKQQRKQKKIEKQKKIQQQYSNLPKRDLRSQTKSSQYLESTQKNFTKGNQKQQIDRSQVTTQSSSSSSQQLNFQSDLIQEETNNTSSQHQNYNLQHQDQLNQLNFFDEENFLQKEQTLCNQLVENQTEENQIHVFNDQYLNSSSQQAQIDLDGSNKDQSESNFLNFETELAKASLNCKVNKKNVVKNIMSSFQRFIYSAFSDITQNENQIKKEYLFQKTKFHVYFNQEQEKQAIQLTEKIQSEVIQIYNNGINKIPTFQSKEEFIHKFKRYFTNRQFNNCTIKHLIKHKSFSKIFQYYLQYFFRNWLVNINIQNIESHILISDLFLKSFGDKQLLINLTNRQK